MAAESARRDDEEHADLVDELVVRLQEAGAPEGSWLIEIEQVRRALHDADDLLRKMRETIIRSATERRRGSP